MSTTPSALPHLKTQALTTRAVIDLHDPNRSHLALCENVEALTLPLANGMPASARDALLNIVNCWRYCDDSVRPSREASAIHCLRPPRSLRAAVTAKPSS
jgi:hypothetical protein